MSSIMTHTNVTVHVSHVISLLPISSYILSKQGGRCNLPDPITTGSDLRYLRPAEPKIGQFNLASSPDNTLLARAPKRTVIPIWTTLSPKTTRWHIPAIDGRT